MTEEIKEILDRIKDINNYDSTTSYEDNKITEEYDMYISKEDVDKLLDYITNLQQKLEQYEKTQTYGDYVETVNKVVELQKENKILKELNICVGCENNPDYKSRCEKAIEYMKLIEMDKTDKYIPIRDYNEYKKLLNILNGSDEK